VPATRPIVRDPLTGADYRDIALMQISHSARQVFPRPQNRFAPVGLEGVQVIGQLRIRGGVL